MLSRKKTKNEKKSNETTHFYSRRGRTFFIFYWRVHLIVLQVESIVQVNTVFTFFCMQKNFTLVAETRAWTQLHSLKFMQFNSYHGSKISFQPPFSKNFALTSIEQIDVSGFVIICEFMEWYKDLSNLVYLPLSSPNKSQLIIIYKGGKFQKTMVLRRWESITG